MGIPATVIAERLGWDWFQRDLFASVVAENLKPA
jgi:hypothetical protein